MIVESPAKAKTIAGFLGSDYLVESSIGHIRDLPSDASEVPASIKGEPWARLGVDVENDFKAYYVVSRDKREQVAKLKRLLAEASRALPRDGRGPGGRVDRLAPERGPLPTRPGATGWSSTRSPQSAISEAIAHPRELDRRLVDAQEARRILDRLYGYEVSPVLWRKVAPRLVGRAGAERRHADRRRAGAGADGIPLRLLVGRRGSLRSRREQPSALGSPTSAAGAIATGEDFLPERCPRRPR